MKFMPLVFVSVSLGIYTNASSQTLSEVKTLGSDLLAAQNNGQIDVSSVRSQIEGLARSGETVAGYKITQGLYQLLRTYLDSGYQFRIMSLTRPGQGPHGIAASKLTAAVDIDQFDGNNLKISSVSEAQEGVLRAIEALPAETIDIGLPRAPYNVDIEPERAQIDCQKYSYLGLWDSSCNLNVDYASLNVFIDPKYNEVPPSANFDTALNFVQDKTYLEALKTSVEYTRGYGTQFGLVFADGLDHMHIKVVSKLSKPH